MLFFSVKTLLIRTKPLWYRQSPTYAPPYLPCFPSLPHSQNPYIPIYNIPNDLRTLAKNKGVYLLKAKLRRNSSIAAHQSAAKSRPAFGLFTKPSLAPRHHSCILHSLLHGG